ncbi:IS1341-type transposase ISNamo22 [Natronomonas moolapensis 8.8.11]|uniref:IS1341-type transposase ISNamo22 n=1 Tax=Natronomonas moolapensis (strain DSM 18674 / CECT 7526 / JCM 14361 / 8.8.11) TaxID=268739 RepID=M1XNV1_NATM8|nr:IS200/IS605 family transposase [Natronomonas moolapensis]CCQ35643.1 IS1341-type transposase ISNamo22 [Natronomonas moolapensis 8.8.11]
MKRTNTFAVRPLSDTGKQLLRDLLDASAALWNEVNYQRLMRYNDEGGFEGDVWDADTGRLEGQYKGVLGASTAQQVIRKNSEAWRGFFDTKNKYHDESNTSVTEHPEPPGFRGNEDDGRILKTVIRNTSYTVEWGERSRLEILVGSDLKDRYDHTGRLRLEIAGDPNWPDYEKQGRLDLWYDETDNTFRASQPVTVSDETRDTPLASEKAALDIGANSLVACTTTTGEQYLYEGRELFQRFRETTREIARLQSKLEEGRYSSERIERLYRKRTRRRDHAQEALCRDLLERLHSEGVDTVYIGGLTDVLETHWSVKTNAKTHNFWAFKQFTERLACTAEEYGISVEVRSEAWTSQECPQCGSTDRTTRHQDTLTCPCGFEGHADLTASETFLERHTEKAVRPMARPVRFEWDDHEWSESPHSHRPKEQRTDPSTVHRDGNVASGGS